MPVLTNPRHERFAQLKAAGMSATEAYEKAGFQPNDGNACKLANRPEILDRIKEITGAVTVQAMKQAAIDKTWVIERLVENVNRAMQAEAVKRGDEETGEYRYEGSVANRALELLGKELGMFIERKEVGKPGEFDQMSDAELNAEITSILQNIGAVPVGKPRRRGNGTEH